MYVEADNASVGIFPAKSGREHAAAGRLFFRVLAALGGEEPERVVLSVEPDPSRSAREPLSLVPDSMITTLLPTGRADWRIVAPESVKGYRVYWDICDHFVTLISPDSKSTSFHETVCDAVERERDRLGASVTTNWDAPTDPE